MVEVRNDPATGMLVVTVPALPGCCTQGRDLPQALDRIREAIEGYLECLKEDGLPIPVEDDPLARIKVNVAA